MNIYILVENRNKKTKTKFKVCSYFFINHLAALRSTLCQWQGDSLTHTILLTTRFQVKPGSFVITLVPKVWPKTSSRKPSDSGCNVLSYCVTHSESVPETLDHLVANFFSRNYKSFSLILNKFNTQSQCYYSNFKHVNIGWEVHRWLFVKLIQWCQNRRITIHRIKSFKYFTVTP